MRSNLRLRLVGFGIGLCLALVGRLAAQAEGYLLNLDIESSELRVTLGKVLEENARLQQRLAESQRTLAEMRQHLAASSGEGEIFKRHATELKLRIDALGLESQGSGTSRLEQRLLTAVSDLRVVTQENRRLSEALARLSEASSFYAKSATTSNAEARVVLEAEIRHANSSLGSSQANVPEPTGLPANITDGLVISVKDELAVVVMNIGSSQGVKAGMPFQVIRGKKSIGSVRAVDIREKIAGAVIQNLDSENDRVRVGDRLVVDAR